MNFLVILHVLSSLWRFLKPSRIQKSVTLHLLTSVIVERTTTFWALFPFSIRASWYGILVSPKAVTICRRSSGKHYQILSLPTSMDHNHFSKLRPSASRSIDIPKGYGPPSWIPQPRIPKSHASQESHHPMAVSQLPDPRAAKHPWGGTSCLSRDLSLFVAPD